MNYKFRGPNLQIYLFIYLLQNSYLEKTGTDWGIFKAFILLFFNQLNIIEHYHL